MGIHIRSYVAIADGAGGYIHVVGRDEEETVVAASERYRQEFYEPPAQVIVVELRLPAPLDDRQVDVWGFGDESVVDMIERRGRAS